MGKVNRYICESCGTEMNPRTLVPGSFFIELILWCAFIIPGLIYSIWRLTSKKTVCPECKGSSIVPLHTPKGKLLSNKYKLQQGI